MKSINYHVGCSNDPSSAVVRIQPSDTQESQNTILSLSSVVNSISQENPNFSDSTISSEPATILETSQHFFPEAYTLESQIPRSCLVVINAYEQSASIKSLTNFYRLLYLKSPRQWYWLTVSIDFDRQSKYWTAVRTTRGGYKKSAVPCKTIGPALLPFSLLTQIQTFLCQDRDVGDAKRIYLTLSGKDVLQRQPHNFHVDIIPSISSTISSPLDALSYLHDLGCPRFVESQVVQLEIIDPPHCFGACINGILVYEIKCRESSPNSEFLYSLRVLHCMKGTLGFAKLVGIVTDDEGIYLKSYLVEFPRARWNILQLAKNPQVSWQRREKWALQLIRGISQVHEKGFVFGGLTVYTIPLVLDSTDDLCFWSFKERLVSGRKLGAYYPPEFCYLRDLSLMTDPADCPCVTSKTDIFHLGLLLWLLAEGDLSTNASPVCMWKQCDAVRDGPCDSSHLEPVLLPQLPESVPKYYRDIVDNCRAEKSSDRPAARELLSKFPFVNNLQSQPKSPERYIADINISADGIRTSKVACDHCNKWLTQLPVFHCNICEVGDFDLCPACLKSGEHCLNSDHLLVELGKIGSWTVPLKYYSCVRSSGVRDVINL